MANLQLTSNITFLYFNDLEAAKPFLKRFWGLRRLMIRAGRQFTGSVTKHFWEPSTTTAVPFR